MIDLTYYNKQVVTLEQVLAVLKETGYKAQLVEELNEIQIEVEPMAICNWYAASYEELDNPNEQEYVVSQNIQSIHLIGLNQHLAPALRSFLKLLFRTYGGWIVDNETPNFYPDTKGQTDIYTIENVESFLRTLPHDSSE